MAAEKITPGAIQRQLVASLPALWRFSLSLTGAPDRADDLVQLTCLRALERVAQVHTMAGIEGWFLTICRSVWFNELRAERVRSAHALATTAEYLEIRPSLDAEANIFAAEVFAEVMRLPEAQRAVVLLVLVEGYAYREAAEILDVPMGTVMSRLNAARGRLKRFADKGDRRDAAE